MSGEVPIPALHLGPNPQRALGAEYGSFNVARRLDEIADTRPYAIAIAEPSGRFKQGRRVYRTITFAELAAETDRLARGFVDYGVKPGMRLALLVRPSIDFIALVFGLLKSGAVQILIDPGLGRRHLIRCLAEAEPEGFVAMPAVQAIRFLLRRRFPRARFNVTVGRRLWWDGVTLVEIRRSGTPAKVLPETGSDDPAAIIFTTGSTGPPKGVLYRHGNFARQVTEIRDKYGIMPGEIDLPCFPLFGLFNCAMGVTTVLPQMDPSHPAKVDPRRIVEAIHQWQVTQSFGSPAVWNRVGAYCRANSIHLSSVCRVMSAGAPVPARVLAAMKACIHPDGEVHTPYGATEALPVATIAASEVLEDTWRQTEQGRGICVGRRFPGIDWRIIRIVDGPILSLSDSEELPSGEIGELMVRGPVVTAEYVTRREANAVAKIKDRAGSEGEMAPRFWHRMGDAGYLDHEGRFWFCGRVAHRVVTKQGPMYTIPCEAIFNRHPRVFRSALVGIGQRGSQRPVIVIEPERGKMPRTRADRARFAAELRELAVSNAVTASIDTFLFHRSMPVDIRHNAKIFREKLAVWAARRLC